MTRPMQQRLSAVVALALALALLPRETNAMFSMFKMCLFSEISGTVVQGGHPVAGATIEREYAWDWKNERGTDQTTTNEKGEFRFPAIMKSSFLGGLVIHQPVIRQVLTVKVGTTSYKAWAFSKRDYEENGELKLIKIEDPSVTANTLKVICNLDDTPQRISGVYGLCRLVNP